MSGERSTRTKYSLRDLKSNQHDFKIVPSQSSYFDNIPDELLLMVRLISKAQNLKSLSIEVDRIDFSELCKIMPLLPNLTTLCLRDLEVSEYANVFQAISKLVHLSSLILKWTDWPMEIVIRSKHYALAFDEFLLFLQSCPLIHLEIDIYRIRDPSLGQFSRFHQLRSLQIVNSSDLGPQGIEAIGTLENLTSLYIECVVGKFAATDLAKAFQNGTLKNLTTFGMQNCKITFQSTNQVALLSAIGKCCSSLRNVCLLDNLWLTAKGVVALADSCPTLRLLEVREYAYMCDEFTKSWDTTSMLSVIVNLEDLIINEKLPADVKQTLVEWNRENPFPRITYRCHCHGENWNRYDLGSKPHKIFFEY